MASSFQNEIPKSRVNITLDVDANGAKKKLELPMKLLTIGDFSGGKTKGKVADRERINITKQNVNTILSDLNPEANFSVKNVIANDDSEIRISIKFDNYKSFDPESLVRQIPELDSMLAMRNLLKDLKSNLLDNGKFRKELERIVNNKPDLEGLRSELEKIAPVDSSTKVIETE